MAGDTRDPRESPYFGGSVGWGGYIPPDNMTLERQKAHWKAEAYRGLRTMLDGPRVEIDAVAVTGVGQVEDSASMMAAHADDDQLQDLRCRFEELVAEARDKGLEDPGVRAGVVALMEELQEFANFDFYQKEPPPESTAE